MLINSIHYTFAPEDAERAESLFRELPDASRKEPGVVQFEIGRGRGVRPLAQGRNIEKVLQI